MSRLAALANSLGNVRLSAPEPREASHTLLFEYPVKDLVPLGGKLRLEQPSLVALRERPSPDPTAIGVYDTFMFAMLLVQPKNPFAIASPDPVEGLLAAVETVAVKGGQTTMEIATLISENSETAILFRLRDSTSICRGYALNHEQWREMLKLEAKVT